MSRSNLYRPLDWLAVRAPLLAVEEYLALSVERPSGWPTDTAPGTLMPADPRVRRALAVGAGDLMRALEQPAADARDRQRMAVKLQRYMIRMSSRPTPFGLFAGVALAGWGERTDVEIADAPATSRTRPDMGWLLDFVSTMEKREDVRSQLRWFANPAAFAHAGRVFMTERTPIGDDAQPGQSMSLRATGAVRRALEFARSPVPYRDLVTELTAIPGATVEKVERLLSQLWEQTLLLTDLRPPLTADEPARYVAQRLAAIPAAADDTAAFAGLLDDLNAWDRLDADQAASEYSKLVAKAQSVHSAKVPKGPFQTDMAMPLAGRLVNRVVADEAAWAAELLLRLSPHPAGLSYLDAYRNAFLERYGSDREVALLELLDPELGLGALAPVEEVKPDDGRQDKRDRTLTDLALNAIRDRRHVIELDEPTIAKLQLRPLVAEQAPTSMDVSLFLVAKSPAAVDTGDFRLVVGPNLGGSVAGRVLGRFADLIGPEAEEALRGAAGAETTRRPGRVWAEVTYLPRAGRMANVAIRPLVRERELAFDTTAGAPADRVIPLSELVVGIRDDRLVARWSVTGQELVACAGHMLNPQAAPAVLRFLDVLTQDGRAMPSTFDWGPAITFPFLPRVQAGRIVLAPARWRLNIEEFDVTSVKSFTDAFAVWREHWQVPRYVYLALSDHRLLLDLELPTHVEQLRIEARGKSDHGRLVLSEALPAPDHAWLPGPDGHYISELVVPVVLDGVEAAAEPVRTSRATAGESSDRRLRPPGSDWMFAKLYHLPTFEQDLLVDQVRTFCAEAVTAGLADSWFFMRYADPDPHVRLRWAGHPAQLADHLAPAFLRWSTSLVAKGFCRRVGLDTYEQEVERYGGPAGMELAEELFAADSVAVLDLLQLVDERVVEMDSSLLGVYTVDDLVRGLGLRTAEQDDLYRRSVLDKRETSKEYRTRQGVLRSVLGDPDWLAAQAGGDAIAEILARRRVSVRGVAARYDELASRGQLVRSRFELARSFVHMHTNRLLGCGHPPEQRVLGLLLRARESLQRAPLQRRAA